MKLKTLKTAFDRQNVLLSKRQSAAVKGGRKLPPSGGRPETTTIIYESGDG
ncbi:MAG: hypothetical protein AAF990_07525 [Bacteroidota bacterium]